MYEMQIRRNPIEKTSQIPTSSVIIILQIWYVRGAHIYVMISYMIQFYPSNVEQFTNPQLPKSLNATWFFTDELSDKDWTKDFGSGTILVKPEICKCTTTVSIETSNQMHWQLPNSTQQWPRLIKHQPWWGRYISCL